MDKSQLREQMRARRQAVDPQQARRAADEVADRVLALEAVQEAQVALIYIAARGELDTAVLRRELLRGGTRVCVPFCPPGDEPMQMRLWEGDLSLVPGRFGIPTGKQPVDEPVDLVICPGLAFDAEGHRLGYGAGYYDRFLAAHPDATAVGIGYSFQLVEAVPHEEHDQRMDAVLTPEFPAPS